MNALELDRVAIWTPKAIDSFTVRKTPAGRIAYANKIAYKTEAATYRYAKNVTIGGAKYCLFYVTYDDDAAKAERFLDNAAKEIEPEDYKLGGLDFAYTDIYAREIK